MSGVLACEMSGGMMAGMALFWLVLAALLVAGAVALFRYLDQSRTSPAGADAVGVLEERYARGEIDREEFEERRATLRQGR